MKSFSNIGDPYGFSRPDEAYVPPRRIISLLPKFQGSDGVKASIDVSWNGALAIIPSLDSVSGSASIQLPATKDVPNGWSISFLAMEYSNTTAQVYPWDNDGFGVNSYDPAFSVYYIQPGIITTFTAVDFGMIGGSIPGGTPTQSSSYPRTRKRWIISSSVGQNARLGGGAAVNNSSRATYDAAIVAGANNQTDSSYTFIGQGYNNKVYNGSSTATLLNGDNNGSSGSTTYTTVLNGSSNRASGSYSTILNGSSHYATGSYSTFLNGAYSHNNTLNNYTMFTSGGGLVYGSASSSYGVSNIGLVGLAVKTTDANPKALTTDGGTAGTANQLTFPNNTTWLIRHIRGSVVAGLETTGTSKAWEFKCVMRRLGTGNVQLVGTPVIDVIAGDSGASAWTITLSADTTNQCLSVVATGAAASNIRWNCRLDLVDVGH